MKKWGSGEFCLAGASVHQTRELQSAWEARVGAGKKRRGGGRSGLRFPVLSVAFLLRNLEPKNPGHLVQIYLPSRPPFLPRPSRLHSHHPQLTSTGVNVPYTWRSF